VVSVTNVCLGVEPTLWTFDQILLPFQEFGSVLCKSQSSQSQNHFMADSQSVSQSVCLGVEPTLCTFDQKLLPFQEFGSVLCKSQSSQSQNHFMADSQSVSQYVLVSSPLCGRLTRYCFLFKSLGLQLVVLSLWGAPSYMTTEGY
jgi:hypothetical protein